MRHLRSAVLLVISTMLFPVASLEAASPPTAAQVESAKSVFLVITPYSRGSATYIKDGIFVTAYHCIDDLSDGDTLLCHNPTTGRSHLCTVWKGDYASDIALLVSVATEIVPEGVELARRDVQVGETVMNVGYGEGLHKSPEKIERRVYGGKVLQNIGRVGYPVKFWYVHKTAAISGDSGGGSFSADGKLIGVLWGSNSYRDYSVCGHNSALRALIRR